MLHLPEEESVVLSGAAARRLVEGGDGDAALLYIAVLRRRGSADGDQLRAELRWDEKRFRQALDKLESERLVTLPGSPAPVKEPGPAPERRTEYTREDMARALEGGEFAALTGAVEEKLGKKLTTPDMGILLGLYDGLGLPSDVIFLLVGFCTERTAAQYGPGRKPTMRQVEKEGYAWARLGLMTQETAAAYIKKYQKGLESVPALMRILRLGERAPAPSEEKYLLSWNEMGFEPEAIELAYDKTIMKCKELKWAYMNKILSSWHQKGLHTLAQIKAGDRPGKPSGRPQPAPKSDPKEDMARMEKYLRQIRGQDR